MEKETIRKINLKLKLIKIKGKDYAEVKERVSGFRSEFVDWTISTKYKLVGDMVIFRASVIDPSGRVISTGTAYEVKDPKHIVNNASYFENCETSAVGRALGFMGIGINTAIASADEMERNETQSEAEDFHVYDTKEKLIKAIKMCKKITHIDYIRTRNLKLFEDMDVAENAQTQKDLIQADKL